MTENWQPLGAVSDLKRRALTEVSVGRVRLALSCVNGEFAAVSAGVVGLA